MGPNSTNITGDENNSGFSFPVVAIGASAGGLHPLQCFISVLPKEFGFSVVFMQHLSTAHKSLLAELLNKARPDLEIFDVSDNLELLPGKIYLCPPGQDVRINKGKFLTSLPSGEHPRLPIDEFFTSLAEEAMEERSKAEDQVKKSLREKEVLLREIHHRVKNNLQIIQSMLKLQLPQIKDEKAIALFKESQNRVYSMALIHEKLYQSESLSKIDFPEYIRSLTAYLFTSYGAAGRAIRPKILMKDISLDVDTTIPCALIINELVSNALKHAFPASRRAEEAGEICIDLHRDTDDRFLLTVSDNGVGLPEGFEMDNRDSLGLKLVGVLVKQLGGAIHIGHVGTGGGAEFIISFTARSKKGD
jgi:two-component sensor histidine kinase